MKRNLADFTRGSQLLGHFSFMFAAGLKGPVILTAIVFSWLTWWEITTSLTDHQVYLLWMRLYAELFGFIAALLIGFQPESFTGLGEGSNLAHVWDVLDGGGLIKRGVTIRQICMDKLFDSR